MKIRQAGPTMYEIRDGRVTVGHIWKHTEGWRAQIGAHEAMAATPEDAATAAYAEVTGQSISEIAQNNSGFLEMKESKKYIYRILAWLAENAARHSGSLLYKHADLASVLSSKRPKNMSRVLGNLTSLMDLACVKTGLPAIGCTPEEGPFAKAWQRETRTWSYPVPKMIERARSHRWTPADFESLRIEIQGFKVWSAKLAWDDTMEKEEDKVKDWANQQPK